MKNNGVKTKYYFLKVEREDWQPDIYVKTIRKKYAGLIRRLFGGSYEQIDICFCEEIGDRYLGGTLNLYLYKDNLLEVEFQTVSEDLEYELSNKTLSKIVVDIENSPIFYLLDNNFQKEIYEFINKVNQEILKCNLI